MPKIISAFSGDSGLSDTMAKLGQTMFGGNSTDNALKSEQLYALQRANAETDNLMKRVAAAKAQNLGADPIAQAVLIGAGYDPAKFAAIGRMGAATEFGANDPRTANWQIAAGDPYSATAPAFNSTLAETARAHDQQSADRRYDVNQTNDYRRFAWTTPSANEQVQSGDRRYATDQSQLTERMKPVPVFNPTTHLPDYAPTNSLATSDMQPILSEAERKGTILGDNWNNLPALNPQQQEVLGARVTGDKAGTPKNYILPGGITLLTYDGQTDVFGKPLPAGGYIGTVQGSASDTGVTNAVKTDLQSDLVSADNFTNLGQRMLDLTKQDPSAFGLVGKVTSMAQEANQALRAAGYLFGGEKGADEALSAARKRLADAGLAGSIPTLYNPNLPKVQMLGGLMLYSAASALGGQENRSVSDGDIKKMEQIIGDPQSMFESAQSIQTKVGMALEIVAEHKKLAQQYLSTHPGVTQIPPEAGLVDAAMANVLSRDPANAAVPAQDPAVRQTRKGVTFKVLPDANP